MSAARLLCVPDGMNSAASLPSIDAIRSCSALTVGSSPNTSSPSGAAIIASRIAGVGRVTVSLRRSMVAVIFAPRATSTPPDSPGKCGPAWERPGARPEPSVHLHRQEVAQHRMTVLRQDRLGMELHTLEHRGVIAHAHDLAVFRRGGHLELARAGRALDRERVVADHAEASGQAREEAALIGAHRAGLAVHQPLRTHDAPAERRADALVPKAHAEDRQAALERANRRHADP